MRTDKNAEVVLKAEGGWGGAGFGLTEYSCFHLLHFLLRSMIVLLK